MKYDCYHEQLSKPQMETVLPTVIECKTGYLGAVGGSDVNEFGNFSKEPEISVFTTVQTCFFRFSYFGKTEK